MQEVRSFAFYGEKISKDVEILIKRIKIETKVFEQVEVVREEDSERKRWFIKISVPDGYEQWLADFVRLAYVRICGFRYLLKDRHDRINLIYSARPFKGWGYQPYRMVISPT